MQTIRQRRGRDEAFVEVDANDKAEKGEKWGLRSKREMVDNKAESRTGLLNFMS